MLAGEEVDRVLHLDRIAGGGSERLVHVGDQRRGLQAGAVGHRDQAFGQRRAIVELLP